MASRMDRYYKSELVTSGRSSRNVSLYKQIEDLDSYTNIEGVATIDKTNEIDITKVKEMLQNRENYKKQKKLKSLYNQEKEEIKETPQKEEEPKNYDINDILSKVKKSDTDIYNKYRSLGKEQYETLKSLSIKEKEYNIEKEEAQLKELIHTIANNKSLNQLKEDTDVGLLDELKSNTMVGDASSIKKIIDEEKRLKEQEDTMEMDKSFYTSSFGFTQSDFEELKNMNHNIKKSNKFIIILLVVLIFIIVVAISFFLLKNK